MTTILLKFMNDTAGHMSVKKHMLSVGNLMNISQEI